MSDYEAGWLYERSDDGSARFVLGTLGNNPLVCFGVNPSIAVPNSLDPTVRRLSKISDRLGFDSWTMLNISPQISTDPKLMLQSLDSELKIENESQIANLIGGRPLALLGAWGRLITSRPYLASLLVDIVDVTDASGCTWVSYGSLLVDGHPRHLSRAASGLSLLPFDIKDYLPQVNRRKS